MPRVPCWSALLFLPVFATSGQAPPHIGVYMQFDAAPAATLLNVMEGEVGDLLKASGVWLDWRLAGKTRVSEAFSELVVLKFKGSCRAEPGAAPAGEFGTLGSTRTLGSTLVSHGRVLPFSEVRCDEVRNALAFLRPGANFVERQRALGLALGRVVAHELYHILGSTTGHASQGLAKASHSLDDLVSDHLRLDGKDTEAIREGVAAKEKKAGTSEAPE